MKPINLYITSTYINTNSSTSNDNLSNYHYLQNYLSQSDQLYGKFNEFNHCKGNYKQNDGLYDQFN